jgi:DNA ligase (NAD+)
MSWYWGNFRLVLTAFLIIWQRKRYASQAFPFQGKTFVFTGKLKNYTRGEAQGLVERLGARTTSSVSGETDYVIGGEDPGSKLDQAKKYKTEVLDEGQFDSLLRKRDKKGKR